MASAEAKKVSLQGVCNSEMAKFRQAGVGEEELKNKGPGVLLAKRLEPGTTTSDSPVPSFSNCELDQFT